MSEAAPQLHISQFIYIGLWGSQMPPFNNVKRVYAPEELSVMTLAYDKAYQRLPKEFYGNRRAARKLALLIMRAVDRGERDTDNLADLATLEFFR